MSDRIEFQVDTRTLAAAKTALEAVAAASGTAEKAAGRFRDAQGRLREANGRFVPVAQQVAEGIRQQGSASAKAARESSVLADSMNKLKGAVAGYLTLQTALRVVKEADAWQSATARLALYTGGLEQARALQDRLAITALRSGQSVEGLTSSYARLAQSSRTLGASQEQLLAVTKGVADAFRVGGTDAQQASAAALQLSQSLGAGTLASDELRSILENSGRLAQAIADGLGVATGEMKKLGSEGELTSRAVFLALLSQTRTLAAETAKLPLTVSQAWQNMTTAATVAIARVDAAIGGTRFLARLLDGTAASVLALAAPDVAARMRGEAEVGNNRALTAAGAATIFNQSRRRIGIREAEIDRLIRENGLTADGSLPRDVFGTATPAGRDAAREAADRVRRLRLLNEQDRGRTTGAEQFFAQGGGISAAAFDREIAAERSRAAAAQEAERAATEAARRNRRALDPLNVALPDVDLTDFTDPASVARRRRIAAGIEIGTGDPVLDARLRALESGALGELRGGVRGAGSFGPETGRGVGIADMGVVRATRIADELQQTAAEARRQFAENLRRGVFEGLQQPIAEFLRTWKLSTDQMGKLLRDALANAIASVAANELTKLIYRVGDAIRRGPSGGSGSKIEQGLNIASTVRSLFGGSVGGATPPVLSWGGAGKAAGTAGAWASALALPALFAAGGLGFGAYVASISGGNGAARAFNDANMRAFRASQARMAAMQAEESAYFASIPAGGSVSNAPANFDIGRYRALALAGATVNITLPTGTTAQQVDAFLDEMSRRAIAQSGNPAGRDGVNVS